MIFSQGTYCAVAANSLLGRECSLSLVWVPYRTLRQAFEVHIYICLHADPNLRLQLGRRGGEALESPSEE